MGDERSANSGAGILVAKAPLVDQILDALAGPESGDAGMKRRGRSVESEIRFIRLISRASVEDAVDRRGLGNAAVEGEEVGEGKDREDAEGRHRRLGRLRTSASHR